MFTFILIAIAAASQSDALFSGVVPQDVPTFQVAIPGGELFYAGVKVDGRWLTDNNAEIKPTQEIELYHDDPWAGQEPYRTLRRRVKELKYETGAMRRHRLESMWSERGYAFQQTANGWRPVNKDDSQYAAKARQLITAKKAAKAAAPVTPIEAQTPASVKKSPLANRNVLAGIAALLVSGGCLFAVFKWLILPDDANWQKLS